MIFRGPRTNVTTETTIEAKAMDLYQYEHDFGALVITRQPNGQKGYVSEGILATTGSNVFTANQYISGNLETTGTTISKHGFIYQTTEITTATYSASFDYQHYGVTYTAGTCSIALPLCTSPADDGRYLSIADETGSISYGNRGIYVHGANSQKINGYNDILMKIDRMSLTFLYRNNSWKTI